MWVFTKYGAFSAGCVSRAAEGDSQGDDVELIEIRAFAVQHLDALKRRFRAELSHCEIVQGGGADCPSHLSLPKTVWAQILMHLAAEIEYGDLKTEVASHQGTNGEHYQKALRKIATAIGDLHASPPP